MKSRKAAIAVARKLVVMIFSMLKNGTLFMVEKERTVSRLQRTINVNIYKV